MKPCRVFESLGVGRWFNSRGNWVQGSGVYKVCIVISGFFSASGWGKRAGS